MTVPTVRERFESAVLIMMLAAAFYVLLAGVGLLLGLGEFADTAVRIALMAVILVLLRTWLPVSHMAAQIEVLKVQVNHLKNGKI